MDRMGPRTDREDLTRQREAVQLAREGLQQALAELAREATLASKAARSKRGRPDLDAVRGAIRVVDRAEEAADLAAHDLHTASGGDG